MQNAPQSIEGHFFSRYSLCTTKYAKGEQMRYRELIEQPDAQQLQVKAQKDQAKQQLKNARRANELAKAADLRLKQQQTQKTLAKISNTPIG
ncbi:hypothetical protein [Herbaspirillum aquaticum]|uniref:Uncharacterized protein n=1 Tax=Herbaspirillum aquaticum TaxID=568783 RepID=A0A225STK9_9BURK|nr:hypothetical protein [Herbaspirillum aquaticum]OWY33951.1 hypothetical protein CEJ45_15095 [Herbaspirillum aquaticum]